MDYINAVLNVFFSPITFLLFCLITSPFTQTIFTSGQDTNTTRLSARTYFIFCIVIFVIAQMLVLVYNISSPQKVLLLHILQPKNYFLSLISWFVTAFILTIYRKGMEGNVMGFIFFPVLLMLSLTLFSVNIRSLLSHFNMGGKPLPLNIWLAFLIHGCNPAMALLIYTDAKNNKTIASKPPGIAAYILPIYLFYAFIILIHWAAFTFAGKNLSLKEFFGVGQSLGYFLPFIGGLLLHIYYAVSLPEKDTDSAAKKISKMLLSAVIILCLMLQFINYAQYLKRVW